MQGIDYREIGVYIARFVRIVQVREISGLNQGNGEKGMDLECLDVNIVGFVDGLYLVVKRTRELDFGLNNRRMVIFVIY